MAQWLDLKLVVFMFGCFVVYCLAMTYYARRFLHEPAPWSGALYAAIGLALIFAVVLLVREFAWNHSIIVLIVGAVLFVVWRNFRVLLVSAFFGRAFWFGWLLVFVLLVSTCAPPQSPPA